LHGENNEIYKSTVVIYVVYELYTKRHDESNMDTTTIILIFIAAVLLISVKSF